MSSDGSGVTHANKYKITIQLRTNNMDKKANHSADISSFIAVYLTLITFFIGFMCPLVTNFKLSIDSRGDTLIFFGVLAAFSYLYKKITIKKKYKDDSNELDVYQKKHFSYLILFYIYYAIDFMLIPFMLGMFLSSLFFI